MNKYALLLYLILLSFISGYAQEKKSYDLEISKNGMTKEYKINYHNINKKIFLVVNKETSIRKFSKKDSLKLMRLFKVKFSESKNEIARIIEDYREYKSDTLVLKQDDWLVDKVNKFVENWNELKQDLEMNPDQRIILDGYTVKISLDKNHQNYEEIYAQNPTKKSHPEIFELISDFENYYKKESVNPVID